MFNTDTEVVNIGSSYLLIVGLFFVFVYATFMLSSAIKGAGDSMFAMISSVISLWLVRIPFAYLLSNIFGINGIWMAIPVGWIVGALVTTIYYIKGSWKNKSVVSSNLKEENLLVE